MQKSIEFLRKISTFRTRGGKGAQFLNFNFYEFHDFVIAERGFAGFEGNSWANDQEQLADITYEWKRVTK